MAKVNALLHSFNRGEISKSALARVDLERTRLSAETQINWMPTVVGPMMLRPGTKYIGATNTNLRARLLPFVFSISDLALLELTASTLRVWIVGDDSETLVTRASVATAVQNGDFAASTGWTLAATDGCTTTISSNLLTLSPTARGGVCSATQALTVAGGDQATEHALRIVVDNGPVNFKIGTTSGDDDIRSTTTLDTGTHSIAFTPGTGTVYIQFRSASGSLDGRNGWAKVVSQCTIEAAGVMTLPTPWGANDLPLVRYDQSGDIVFIACYGDQQRKIERRSTNSWSVVLYRSEDGPFQSGARTTLTLTPGAYYGNTTLTASVPFFKSTHVGALFRLYPEGQNNQALLGAAGSTTDAVRISGVGGSRNFNYVLAGTWAGTVALEKSFDGPDSGFSEVATQTANGTYPVTDTSDNVIVWYRVRFKTYTSGAAQASYSTSAGGMSGGGGASAASGGLQGIVRVTARTSSTVAQVEVIKPFSSITATSDWRQGEWSLMDGWPSAVAFHDGRLWWSGRDKIWASVSDAFTSFNDDTEGDAGPISRSVGFGPVDITNWLLPLTRLIVGREGSEVSVRSSAFDEPITPTNFTIKPCSTQGSARLNPVRIDTRGVFIQQSSRKVYELVYSSEAQDYIAVDLTRLNTDIGTEGFAATAVQRQPDTMIHFPRDDRYCAVLMREPQDDVNAWWRVQVASTGNVQDVCVLPGSLEDRVYYVVRRTIDGSTVRYIERLTRRDQNTGRPGARLMDAHIIYTGGTTTVTGLDHLEGETVVAWAWDDDDTTGTDFSDGDDATPTYTVSSGQITISAAKDNVCVGIPYDATFKSSKLAYGAQMGTALTQDKRPLQIGLIMENTHFQGVKYGQSADTLDPLPLVEDGAETSDDTVWEEFDGPMITLPGEWDTDARLYLTAASPRPATVLAAVVKVQTNE